MKKLRLIFFAVMMIPVLLSAKEKECVGNGIIESWTFSPVQIGLSMDNSLNLVNDQCETIFSLAPYMEQKSAVFSLAGVGGVRNNYGISIAGINGTVENYGLKIGLINFRKFFESLQILGIDIANAVQIGVCNSDAPVQIGLFNVKGRFQIGLWNYNPNAYFQYCPLINFYIGP